VSIDRASVALAFIDTRLAQRTLRSRADIERRQSRLWRRLQPVIARTPALADLAGAPHSAFPVVEPRDLRARLGDWNSLGLSQDAIRGAAEAAERGETGEAAPGVSAGYSTGSEGVRGVFLSSPAERARYLGQSLAKLLPEGLLRRRRIGLCLRANNALYRDISGAGPFTFRYFGLSGSAEQRAKEIEAFAPTLLIAPSFVLAELARFATAGAFAAPRFERLFYGAEPMGAAERAWITETLGARPDPIYQATEGFLGAACKHGTLHLNEDSIIFEFDRLAGSNRHRAVVTDLRRTSQPMIRVRLDDLIEFDDAPCPCGSHLRAIKLVEGRASDIWRWGEARIFPREIETTLSAALGPSTDWRAVGSQAGVTLATDDADATRACDALSALLASAGAPLTITLAPLGANAAPKRRRVRWSDG
jgi:putative adenylate-forming enzyme